MYDNDDPNNPSRQSARGSPSPDRPYQYKRWNCGYDCGEGCQKADEDGGGGGGNDGDSESTLVDSGNTTTYFSDLDSAEWNGIAVRGLSAQSYTSGSQDVQPSATADHSPVASAGGSARSRSPGPGVIFDIRSPPVATPLPFERNWVHSPLRLSPPCEHCRGDTASQLFVPHHSPLWYLMERSSNAYTPGYGYMSPPSAGI
jgi:hypothetical protein